jgi:hypothetical protein
MVGVGSGSEGFAGRTLEGGTDVGVEVIFGPWTVGAGAGFAAANGGLAVFGGAAAGFAAAALAAFEGGWVAIGRAATDFTGWGLAEGFAVASLAAVEGGWVVFGEAAAGFITAGFAANEEIRVIFAWAVAGIARGGAVEGPAFCASIDFLTGVG